MEGEKELSNKEINSMVVNVTMTGGEIVTMFLEGQEYLMTVDKNVLDVLQ
jgi:hypothetical protein